MHAAHKRSVLKAVTNTIFAVVALPRFGIAGRYRPKRSEAIGSPSGWRLPKYVRALERTPFLCPWATADPLGLQVYEARHVLAIGLFLLSDWRETPPVPSTPARPAPFGAAHEAVPGQKSAGIRGAQSPPPIQPASASGPPFRRPPDPLRRRARRLAARPDPPLARPVQL